VNTEFNIEAYLRQIAREEALKAIQEHAQTAPDAAGYMTIEHAAQFIDKPQDTIRKWLQRDQIKRYKAGRSVLVKISEIVHADRQ